MPLIRYIQKLLRDPNFLVWRDTAYISVDGKPQYLSLKLITDVDKLLQGKVSEYVFQTEFKEVKLSCDEIRILGRNLIAEYLYYEGSGSTLHDTSGNKYDGTIVNAVWGQLSNGKYYLEFGGDDYVVVDKPFTVDEYGIEVLAYSDTWDGVLICLPHASPCIVNAVQINYNALTLRVFDCSCRYYDMAISRPVAGWTHIVSLVRCSDGHVKLVHNLTTVNEVTHGVRLYNKFARINIGSFNRISDDYRNNFFNGKIVLTRIWGNYSILEQNLNTLYKLAKVAVPDLP